MIRTMLMEPGDEVRLHLVGIGLTYEVKSEYAEGLGVSVRVIDVKTNKVVHENSFELGDRK